MQHLTPCLEVCRLTIFASHCKKKCVVFFQGSRVLGGYQGLKRTKQKMNTPNVDACVVINSLPKVNFPRLWRLPKKLKLFFFKVRVSKFILQILSSNFYLRISFAKLFNLKLSKTCWKSPKLYKRSLTHFGEKKKSLAQWFWAFFLKDVLQRKIRQNNACVQDVLTAPSNVYLSLGFEPVCHSYF